MNELLERPGAPHRTSTTTVSIERVLAELVTIGLEELDALAALQTRTDRKYLLDPRQLPDVLAAVEVPLRVLDIDGRRSFAYRSTYFDTPDLLIYRDAARSRPKRFKVRTRAYVDTGTCWLEVKVRDAREQTVKDRIAHPPVCEAELTPLARTFLTRFGQVVGHVDRLSPALTTGYDRSTLHCGQRVTIDAGLWCAGPDSSDIELGALAHRLIIETKSPGPAPGPFDRALWQLGVRPTALSKYAVGTAAAHPSIAANKWHRVLRQEVGRIRDGAPA